jgi:hypothetical protein
LKSHPQVAVVARALPAVYLEPLLRALVACLSESPHLEFLLRWVQSVAIAHGPALQHGGPAGGGAAAAAAGGGPRVGMPVLRALQQALARVHADLAGAAESNVYTLDYLVAASKAHAEAGARAGAGDGGEEGGDGEGGRREGGQVEEEEDGGEVWVASRRGKGKEQRRRGAAGGKRKPSARRGDEDE